MATELRRAWQTMKKADPNIDKYKGSNRDVGQQLDQIYKALLKIGKLELQLDEITNQLRAAIVNTDKAVGLYGIEIEKSAGTPSTAIKEFHEAVFATGKNFEKYVALRRPYRAALNEMTASAGTT
ncbi:MAG TPA: hypothetical protein VKB75_05750 [Jatrophihabitans sp.]|nr:hypothetical protein [Jatrophihabitans sp.]